MSTEDAKAYLSMREVPRLFECLMTGLMFHRPVDHIQYLIDSLEKVKQKGQAELTWNMFVEVRSAKTPLPPITPDNGKRPVSRGRVTPKEESRPITPATKPAPLPPIGSSGLPNVPVVIIMGGPGCGKAMQANRLGDKHPGWINVHVGDLLREEITNKGGAEDKWRLVKELVTNGELAPEDVTLNLIYECMKGNQEALGYIIEGFPRDMEQAQEFEKMVSRVDAVFLLDCEEESLTNKVLDRCQSSGRLDDAPNALAKRFATYKEKTLPVLKHYDDSGKLFIINGEQDAETVHDELSIIFETLLQNLDNGRIPTPPTHGKPSSARRSRTTTPHLSSGPTISPSAPLEPDVVINMPVLSYIPPPELKVKDEGRKPDLPQAPVIFVAGGPGSGKGTQCHHITNRYPDVVHLSMGDILRKQISDKGSADEKWAMITKLLKEGDMAPVDVTDELLISSMKEHPSAKAFIVEGYPRDILQYENFNRSIGGQSFTILLDCDDNYLRDRLILRGSSGTDRIDDNIPAIENKLAFFSRNTLPLLKVIDDEGKLIVINGDRDEQEIFFDIVKCLDFSLYGMELEEAKTGSKPSADDDDDDEKVDGKELEAAVVDDTDGKAEVVEEFAVAQNAPVPTGALIANPSYTAELDALEAGDSKQAPEGDQIGEAVDITEQDTVQDGAQAVVEGVEDQASQNSPAEEAVETESANQENRAVEGDELADEIAGGGKTVMRGDSAEIPPDQEVTTMVEEEEKLGSNEMQDGGQNHLEADKVNEDAAPESSDMDKDAMISPDATVPAEQPESGVDKYASVSAEATVSAEQPESNMDKDVTVSAEQPESDMDKDATVSAERSESGMDKDATVSTEEPESGMDKDATVSTEEPESGMDKDATVSAERSESGMDKDATVSADQPESETDFKDAHDDGPGEEIPAGKGEEKDGETAAEATGGSQEVAGTENAQEEATVGTTQDSEKNENDGPPATGVTNDDSQDAVTAAKTEEDAAGKTEAQAPSDAPTEAQTTEG